jgi:signal transduction histidine kinase
MACYKVLGKIDFANGELDNANLNFNEVLKLSEKLGKFSQKEAHAESLFQLAAIALLKNDFEKHKKYLNTLVTFSTRNKLPNFLQSAYKKLLEEAIKNGNIKEVNFFNQKFNEVSDSLEFIHILDQNKLATSISEVHQLNTINQKLTNEGINQKETIKERTDYLMLFLVLSALFLFLLIIVYRLSRRYKQQNEVIETQKVKLEKLNATKDKFFSIVAHDLKSPLNSLKSFSYLLVSHFDNLSKKEIIEMGQQLYNSVDITTKLADNLITWARMQMQEIVTKQEYISINDVINNCVPLYKEAAATKEIKINIKADLQTHVYFDKNQLEFIIRNLLNNAVKFTKPGGTISISINDLPDNLIELKVIDNGVGMPAEILKSINDSGTKISTKGTSGELGTGLGLMLCFEFARLNNTTLVIQSKLNKGTTIVLRLESY